MGIFLAALSALFYGSADFAGGQASRHNSVAAVLVTSQILGLAIALVAAPLLGSSSVAASDLLWGAAAGLSGAVGLAFLYKGIASGIIAIVAPKAAVVGSAVPVVVGSLLGQLPSLTGWFGIAVSIPAIFLLSWEKPEIKNRHKIILSLKYAFIAGLAFGGFAILISQTGSGSGLWPIVTSRTASVSTVLLLIWLSGRKLRVARHSLAAVATAGSLDTMGNIAFLLSSRLIILPIVGVVSGLAPAPTVLLGRMLLKERLGPVRITGLVLALAGVVLLSL